MAEGLRARRPLQRLASLERPAAPARELRLDHEHLGAVRIERQRERRQVFGLGRLASRQPVLARDGQGRADRQRPGCRRGRKAPRPGRVTFCLPYGHYSSRIRGARAAGAEPPSELEGAAAAEEKKKRRCPPRWARLIQRVYQADPLVCRRCSGRLKLTGYLCDSYAMGRVLEELGLAPSKEDTPPRSEEHTSELQSLRHLVCR